MTEDVTLETSNDLSVCLYKEGKKGLVKCISGVDECKLCIVGITFPLSCFCWCCLCIMVIGCTKGRIKLHVEAFDCLKSVNMSLIF